MWKYVSRRIRDTIERSVNHFEKRSATGVVNPPGNPTNDKNKHEKSAPPCRLFCPKRCWTSFQSDDTNSKKWNFDHLNRSWIGAITWSSALVIGWYTSQLFHLKLKYHNKERKENVCLNNKICTKGKTLGDLLTSLHPYINCVNGSPAYLNSRIEKIVSSFTPTVHLMSNESTGKDSSSSTGTSSSPDTSDDELGDVLNSIENRLGLAAIESGHHQDGLNLLRSAANRHHAPAMYNLGLCYEMGLGVPSDEKTAMELYRAAAASEHPGALFNLAIYYGQGRGGLTKDTSKATRLMRLAAVQGHQDAIDALKTLDEDLIEAPVAPNTWLYKHDHIAPTHTTLFVENVKYSQNPSNYSNSFLVY